MVPFPPAPTPPPAAAEPARGTALRWLSRRDLSEAQLRRRLQDAGFAEDLIDDAVEWLRDCRYLDDSRLVSRLLEDAQRFGRGPGWLDAQLRRRGITDRVADGAVQICAQDATERARELVLRRFGPIEVDAAAKARSRAYRFLLGRGFDAATASEVLQIDSLCETL